MPTLHLSKDLRISQLESGKASETLGHPHYSSVLLLKSLLVLIVFLRSFQQVKKLPGENCSPFSPWVVCSRAKVCHWALSESKCEPFTEMPSILETNKSHIDVWKINLQSTNSQHWQRQISVRIGLEHWTNLILMGMMTTWCYLSYCHYKDNINDWW